MADDTPDAERLEELEEHIQKARADADEAVDSFAEEPKERFVDSGDEKNENEDDQTIAPPG